MAYMAQGEAMMQVHIGANVNRNIMAKKELPAQFSFDQRATDKS